MRILPSIRLTRLLFVLIALPAAGWAGTALFPNGDFREGMTGWNLLCVEDAQASADVKAIEGGHAACVTVQSPGAQGYYVQLVQTKIPIAAGKKYKLSFRVRSKPGSDISANLWPTADPDGHALWRVDHIAVTEDWKTYEFDIDPNGTSGTFNLDLSGMARQAGEYWFTDVTLVAVE